MSGHIRRRGERSWELKFDLGRDPITGGRRTRYHSLKGTKREAEAELVRLLGRKNDGNAIDPSKMTVAEFLHNWLETWAVGNVSPKTLERYSGLIRLQVAPHIGHVAIQRLRAAHLNDLYAKLLRQGRAAADAYGDKPRGLSARTVGHVHRVLHRALGHAAQWDVVLQNAAANVTPPRVEGKEIQILSLPQIEAMLRAMSGLPIHPIVVMALATGMRRGELLALRWRDIDLEAGRIRVERSLEETRAKGLRFKSPKTRHGRRTISLAPSAVAELRRHRQAKIEQRLTLGLGKPPSEALVFSTLEGEPLQPDALSKAFTAAMIKIGLPVTLHALRHTHASQLIAGGVDVLSISRRLGHASPAITLGVYGHLFADSDDKAAKVSEALFAKVGTE